MMRRPIKAHVPAETAGGAAKHAVRALKLCPEPMIRRADPLDRPYAVPRMCAIAKSQSSAEEPLYGLWGTGRLFGRNRRVSGRAAVSAEATRLTRLYGPAVRRKRIPRIGECGLASMYPASDWSTAPGHHGYQRACDLISG